MQVTNPLTGRMGDGWWKGLDGRFSKKGADGWGVSTSMAVVPAQSKKSRRLAAKACWVAYVKMADHPEKRGTRGQALRTMSGAALYFLDGRGVEEVQETCSFRAPPWSPLSRELRPPICTSWISFEHDATSEHDYKVYQAKNNTFSANKSDWKNTCLQQRCFSIKRLKITMRVWMASLETLQKHGISDHLVCFLHSFFFQNTRVRAHANRTIFTWCPDWRNAAEGAGDGLAVGAGCPISEIYFGSDAALKHVFKGIPGMVAW